MLMLHFEIPLNSKRIVATPKIKLAKENSLTKSAKRNNRKLHVCREISKTLYALFSNLEINNTTIP